MLHATNVLSDLLQLCSYNPVNSNTHEANYTIFSTPQFLPPPHIKHSPHHPAVTNPQSAFFSWYRTPNFTPTKMTPTMSILWMSTCNILNWTVASIAWKYPALFLQDDGPCQFCQDLTYRKPDLQQSNSGTSQAMWHKIQFGRHFAIGTAHNPFYTVQLFHKYRLPEKQEILNIC